MAQRLQTTGLKSPSATGEDYNQWLNPSNAYTSNNVYAEENTNGHMQDYYNFGFSIPSGAAISGIEVRIEGYTNRTGDVDTDLSWNGGTNYTAAKTLDLPSPAGEGVKIVSGLDLWERTWSDTEFSNANFRLRVKAVNIITGDVFVDHIQVRVWYTENTIVVEDRFTETVDTTLASHIPNTGTGWTLFEGTGDITLSTLKVTAATDLVEKEEGGLSDGANYRIQDAASSADYSVVAEGYTIDSGDDPMYLLGRVQSGFTGPNLYAIEMFTDTNSSQLFKRVSGVWTALGSAFTLASHAAIELDMTGTTITVFVNDSQIVSVTDSGVTGAGFGGLGIGKLRTAGDDMDAQQWDNFFILETPSANVIKDPITSGIIPFER